MNFSMGVHYTYDEIVGLVKKLINPNLVVTREAPDAPFLRLPLAAPYDTRLVHEQLRYTSKFTMETAILDFAESLRKT